MSLAGTLHATPHSVWDSRPLWSLWDMINFGLGAFLMGLDYLRYEMGNARAAAVSAPDAPVSEDQHVRVSRNMKMVVTECCARLMLEETMHTCEKWDNLVNRYQYIKYTNRMLAELLDRLYEDITRGASQQYFFHYPSTLAPLARDGLGGLDGAAGEWKAIIDAFPSAKLEVEAGVDCFAMDNYPGSVFHMMRVAELGLRAVARERGITKLIGKRGQPKPIEWGTWNEVFDAIENQLKIVRQANPGPKRDAALTFYDTALSDLRRMRDLYRDPTMHFRETYDKGEAYSAIARVKELMATLAPYLNETKPRKIRWSL